MVCRDERRGHRRLPSNDSIGKALKALGDRRIGMDVKEMRDATSRFYCGIALNKAGLHYHRTAFEEPAVRGQGRDCNGAGSRGELVDPAELGGERKHQSYAEVSPGSVTCLQILVTRDTREICISSNVTERVTGELIGEADVFDIDDTSDT